MRLVSSPSPLTKLILGSSTLRQQLIIWRKARCELLLELSRPYTFLTLTVMSTPDSITGLYRNTLTSSSVSLMSSSACRLVSPLSEPIRRLILRWGYRSLRSASNATTLLELWLTMQTLNRGSSSWNLARSASSCARHCASSSIRLIVLAPPVFLLFM